MEKQNKGITELLMRFGGPGGLLEQVVFELDFSGMGRISKSEVRKGSRQELE